MIAKRVEIGLNEFLELQGFGDDLRTQIGVVMCDDGYEGVQEILEDLDFTREFVKKQPDIGHWIFTREKIQQMRNEQDL
jgi:hypothetical protein